MTLIYDLVDPTELQGYVRNLSFDQFSLNQFLPDRNIDDIEYAFRRGTLVDQDAAGYRAFDAESPIGKRQGAQRVTGQLPPVSRKISLGEEERLRLRQMQGGAVGALADAIYDDAANMTRAVHARVELARGEALHSGVVTLEENGLSIEIDFGVPAEHQVSAGTTWATTTGNDIIEEMLSWLEIYVDSTSGLQPLAMLTSTRVRNLIVRNDAVRNLAATVSGAPAIVSQAVLDQVLSAYGLPPVRINDTQVRVDGTAQRLIPDDKLIFVPPSSEPLGDTFWGVTAESLELVGAGFLTSEEAPGITAVVEKTFDPVRTWTKASAIALPTIANPELLFQADVIT